MNSPAIFPMNSNVFEMNKNLFPISHVMVKANLTCHILYLVHKTIPSLIFDAILLDKIMLDTIFKISACRRRRNIVMYQKIVLAREFFETKLKSSKSKPFFRATNPSRLFLER